MPVILATEIEIRKIVVQAQTGQTVHEIPISMEKRWA
jgi:hypothetical protein